MALPARKLRRALTTALAALGVAIIVVSLVLLSKTTQNSDQFGRLQALILLINAAGVVVLLILIVGNLVRLIGEYRRHAPGARLKARMVGIFTVLAVVPLMVVYAFSIQFIRVGIDSWFDVEVARGLDEALNVSRTVLDIRMREFLERTETMGGQLSGSRGPEIIQQLDIMRREAGALEVTVFGQNSRIVATSSGRPAGFVPARPPEEVLLQVRHGRPFYELEPLTEGRLYIRTVIALPAETPAGETLVVQALYPVAERLAQLTESVRAAYTQYRELAFLRQPLKASFVLTLTLVLLLSLLAAVWGAFFSGRRLVAPIQNLVAGTRAVAKGDFDTRLPIPARDDIGFLVNSFNDMTRRLADARRDALLSEQEVESERANLEAILVRLSTGVLALEPDLTLRNANEAANAILGADLSGAIGRPLPEVAEDHPMLEHFVQACRGHLDNGDTEWREQIILRGEVGRRVLNCACTALPGEGEQPSGYVLVFDDITALLQAQRDAAWGEVARRLAHEIKNPLTPIQLSAERLRRKYLDSMNEEDARVLASATNTIVHQVEAMKDMVDAFRDYARAPDLDVVSVDLNRLIRDVAELYRTRGKGLKLDLDLDLDPELPSVEADMGRIRQILHNLFSNAVEALHGRNDAALIVRTRLLRDNGGSFVEIGVSDNGPGFKVESLDELFEPYVTSKPKGTGLGLAIVKKIVEEHGGQIVAENSDKGGAKITIVLPIDNASRAGVTLRTSRSADGRRERA